MSASTSNTTFHSQPIVERQQSEEKTSRGLSRISGNLHKLAIPIFLLFTLSMIPTVKAGPLAYAVCIKGCDTALALGGMAITAPGGGWGALIGNIVGLVACPSLCAPALAAPSP
jgi:hypothetical protein